MSVPTPPRARKPSATRTRSQFQPVSKMVADRTATPPATTRAAFSFTGLGKLNTSDSAVIDSTVPAPIALPTELVNFRSGRPRVEGERRGRARRSS